MNRISIVFGYRLSTLLKRSAWIGAGLVMTTCIVLIVLTLYYRTEVKSRVVRVRADNVACADLKSRIAMASDFPKAISSGSTKSAASDFQGLLDREATRLGCTVSEFQASSEAQPYLSRFDKDPKANPWTQIEVSFAIEGRFPDTYAVLSVLADQAVPFEPSSLEILRVEYLDNNTASVVARAQGRVLSRPEEVKP